MADDPKGYLTDAARKYLEHPSIRNAADLSAVDAELAAKYGGRIPDGSMICDWAPDAMDWWRNPQTVESVEAARARRKRELEKGD